jgi:rRNA maturation endonuclease Nob1
MSRRKLAIPPKRQAYWKKRYEERKKDPEFVTKRRQAAIIHHRLSKDPKAKKDYLDGNIEKALGRLSKIAEKRRAELDAEKKKREKRNEKILQMVRSGSTYPEIAEQFRLSRAMIGYLTKINAVKNWRDVATAGYPKKVKTECGRCGKKRTVEKKFPSAVINKFCSERCFRLSRIPANPHRCHRCGSEDKKNLVKSHNRKYKLYSRQFFICRTCHRARYKKYGKRYSQEMRADPVRYAKFLAYQRSWKRKNK